MNDEIKQNDTLEEPVVEMPAPVIEKVNLTEINSLKNEDEIFDALDKAMNNEQMQKLSEQYLEEHPEYKLPLIPLQVFEQCSNKEITLHEISEEFNISIDDIKYLFELHKKNGDFKKN